MYKVTNMKAQTALVLGATGLVGSNLVKLLLTDDSFQKVIILVRSDYPVQHPKLMVRKVHFDNHKQFEESMETGDSIFCCIGTTMKKVKNDKTLYKKIDYDIAVNAAKFGLAAGYKQYLVVSSVGANPASSSFYLHLKGMLEHSLKKFAYNSMHIFQPSVLLGKRDEFRAGELIGKGIIKALSIVFSGPLSKYRAVNALTVAKAMLAVSKNITKGKRVYNYKEMMKLAGSALS